MADADRTRALIQASGIGLWDWDVVTNEVYFSPEWKWLLGYEDHELLNRFDEWESRLHPADIVHTVAAINDYRQGLFSQFNVEFRMRHKDGSWRWILSRADCRRDAAGVAVRMMGCHFDITARKQTEALSKIQTDVLELIAMGVPLKGSLTTLARGLEAHAGDILCSILLVDADGKHLRHGAAPSLPDVFNQVVDGIDIGPVVGSCGTAAYLGEPVMVEDIANDPLWSAYKEFALPHGLRACWSTPIKDKQQKVVGTFAIYYRQAALPTPEHQQLIAMATSIAAVAIGKDRAEAALASSESERRASELRWRLCIDHATDLIMVHGEMGELLDVNLAACEALGYTREELIGHTPALFADGFKQADAASMMARIMTGQVLCFDWEHRRKDGSSFPAEVRVRAVKVDNGWLAVSMARDITSRKQAEAAVRESERDLRLLANNMPGLVSRVDRELRYRYANWLYEKTFGRSHRDILGATVREVVGEELFRQVEPYARRALQGEQVTFETQQHVAPGERRHWLANFVPDRGESGDISGFFILALDITQRREVESALLQSRQRLTELINNLDGIVWEADAENFRMTFVSHQAERILGYPVDAWINQPNFWQLHIHPDDREWVVNYCVEATREGRDHTFQYRMIAADGRVVWLEDRVKVFSRDGKPYLSHGVMVDITERVRTETALRDRDRELGLIVNKVPGRVSHLDGDLRYLYVNDEFVEAFGKPREWIIGRTMAEVIGPALYERDTPYRRLALAGETVAFEAQMTAANGKEMFALVNYVPDMGRYQKFMGLIVIAIDITERKRSEASLALTTAMLERTGELAKVGGWELDLKTSQFTWSKAAFHIYEVETGVPYSVQQALECYAEDSQPQLRAAVEECIATGKPWNLELQLITAKGNRVWVRKYGSAVTVDGKVVKMIGAIQDINEQKQAEAQRASLEAQLRESQKMEAIGTLAGGIAHDFNNIIAAILGNVDLAVMDATEQAPVLESLNEIRKASTRARDLVQRILSFSRRQPSARKLTSLAGVVDESVRLLRTVLPSRVVLEVHCANDVPEVLADAHHLEQVIMNLVTNAMQALDGENGHIAIHLDTVILDAALARAHPALGVLYARHAGQVARLTVRDSGPGMDAATIGRIFEPFFTTKPVGGGTGLGLSVVHGIVQEHEGAIVVESVPGDGATFSIYLPVIATPAHLSEAAATAPARAPVEQGLRILYLDDESALVSMIKRLLERRGYRVSGFTEQQAALDALRADPHAFDIVVTDYNMPLMSGLDVARAVRDMKLEVPVVIATGFIDDQLRKQASDAGVLEFISKAGAAEGLSAAIERLVHTNLHERKGH